METANVEPQRPEVSARTWTARVLVWPACAVALAVHLTFAHSDYSMTSRWHAGLLCCVALISVAFSAVGAFPTVAIGLGYFYAALGMPIFQRTVVNTVDGRVHLSSHSFDQATLGALILACTALVTALFADRASHLFTRGRFLRASDTGEYTPEHTTYARVLAAVTIVVTAVMTYRSNWFGSLRQPIGLLTTPIIPLALLLWDAERTGRSRAVLLFWGATLTLFAIGMLSGMLGNALIPGVTAAGLLWAVRGKLPMRMLTIGIVVVLVLNPAKRLYRDLTWFGKVEDPTEQFAMWGRALEETYSGKSSEQSLRKGIESTNSRVSTLGQVAQMYQWIPSRVPFAGPERWLFVPVMLVPRVFWPNKPVQGIYYNRDYTNTFRLQSKRYATTTSITLPAVGDGYWRLGSLGVVLEGVLLGLLLGIGQGISRAHTRAALLLGGAIMILRTDYHVFGFVNGCLQGFLVMLVVIWIANLPGRRRQRSVTSATNVLERASSRLDRSTL